MTQRIINFDHLTDDEAATLLPDTLEQERDLAELGMLLAAALFRMPPHIAMATARTLVVGLIEACHITGAVLATYDEKKALVCLDHTTALITSVLELAMDITTTEKKENA